MNPRTAIAFLVLLVGFVSVPFAPVNAQNIFAPVAQVNDDTITRYELDQRVRLLEVLRTAGDLEKEALKRLINERLQLQASQRAGIAPSEQDIADGVDEFAARTDRSGKQFLAELNQEGVAPDSFKDFVRSGIAWRQLVRARFAPQANITDSDIDRAIAMRGSTGSAQVLISEIFLPTNTPQNAAITADLAPQIVQLNTVAEFSDAARRFSAGPSRDRGGVVNDWVPLENLPPPISAVLLTMSPGDITEPIEIPNALAIFQLRAKRETVAPALANPLIDYARIHIQAGTGAASLVNRVFTQTDTCDDLYGHAKGQANVKLDRQEQSLRDIPTDQVLELARLDSNEMSVPLIDADGGSTLIMLCQRSGESALSRGQIRQSLSGERLTALADAYLDELRANATITLR